MKLERYFKTQVNDQITRNRIAFYLESQGYRQREAQPDLVYETPARTSSLLPSTTSHYDGVVTIRTLTGTDGLLVVAVSYDLATSTSILGKQEAEYWEGEFSKLVAAVNGPATQTIAAPTRPRKRPDLMARHLNGANWFYWIAGLSVVNSVIVLFGGAWYFLVGLGATQFVDGFMMGMIEVSGPESEFARGGEERAGKQLSFVRFLYMAIHPDRFRETVLAELMPPLTRDGRSLFWDAFGKRFTDLEYPEADKRSRENKEFIQELLNRLEGVKRDAFPSGHTGVA